MFLDFIIVLGVATVVATLFYSVRLPPIVGFLMAGIIAGPHGLKLVHSSLDVKYVTEIAAFLLMFTLGLEFSFKRLTESRRALLAYGTAQVVGTVVIISGLLHLFLEMTWPKSLFIGFLVALSSTATVFKILQDNRETETNYGQVSISILLFQDLAVIPMVLILPFLAQTAVTESNLLSQLYSIATRLVGTILLVGVFSKYLVPGLLNRVARTGSREIFFFCILFICAGTAYLINYLGLSLTLGAFIAGMMISESPYGKQATSDFIPLRDNFLGLFFVSIGMLLDLSFIVQKFGSVVSLSLGMILVKVLVIYSALWFLGNPSSLALITGLILCQVGEFSFILVEEGLKLNLISANERQYFLTMSVMSLAATPFFLRLAPRVGLATQYQQFLPKQITKFAETLRSSISRFAAAGGGFNTPKERMSGHTIIIGFGIAGQNLARSLKVLNLPYQIIEMNADTVNRFRKEEPIFFGDAASAEILRKANIETARLVVLTVAGSKIMESALAAVHRLRPDIRIILRAQYLRELSDLRLSSKTDVVMGEVETTLEILTRVLTEYGADPAKIYELNTKTRKSIQENAKYSLESLSANIHLPGWQVISNMRPISLGSEHKAVGKTLLELNLRQITGASVVSVFRAVLGTTHPHPDFVFETGDIVYVLGTSAELDLAENYFK
ncbi:MAG: cation:proton antiporter [Pseudomonadota bacterium]|nr:cation:proton antiporter [Pseudomonadota bacterium]